VHRAVPRQTELAAVLGTVKDKPFGWRYRAILDRPRARRPGELRSGRKNARGAGRTKEWTWKRWYDPPWQQTSHTRPGPSPPRRLLSGASVAIGSMNEPGRSSTALLTCRVTVA